MFVEQIHFKRNLAKKTVLIVLVLLSVSCSTFRSAGRLKGVNQTEGEASSGPPTISWDGEKRMTAAEGSISLDWPLDEARMTRGFSAGPGKPHWGIDLANRRDTSILAAEAGTVVYTGQGFHGYGNLIVIEHGKDWATLYSHLARITVVEGQKVQQGEKIGLMGRTGHATGVHLHFEVRHNREPVNPLPYLPQGF